VQPEYDCCLTTSEISFSQPTGFLNLAAELDLLDKQEEARVDEIEDDGPTYEEDSALVADLLCNSAEHFAFVLTSSSRVGDSLPGFLYSGQAKSANFRNFDLYLALLGNVAYKKVRRLPRVAPSLDWVLDFGLYQHFFLRPR